MTSEAKAKGDTMTRETRLAFAFVELAEALVSGGELGDFLHRLSCHTVDLLEVDAAGVMLADEHGRLRAIAASNEDTHHLEVFALQHEEGVCLDVFRSGRLEQASIAGTTDRWPHFSRLTLERGYGWVCGIPLRREARNTNRKLQDLAHDIVEGVPETVERFVS
jgi:hypothetical protein